VARSDKRGQIIRAALDLIATNGFHDAPMAMIARRANVGVGTIYCYFENKDTLIQESFKDLEDRILAHLQEGYSVEMPMRERFIHLGTRLLRYFITYPIEFRYLEQFHNSPYGVAHLRDKLLDKSEDAQIFSDFFKQGIAQQIIKDIGLVVLFALGLGPLTAIARDHILGVIELTDSLVLRTVEACWDALKR
jgi:AcrR family transcriptional regulator